MRGKPFSGEAQGADGGASILARIARPALRYITDGWYFKNDEQSRNRRNLLFVNYTANVIVNIVGASFFTGLLITMNADDGFIGLMSVFAVSANLLQMFSPLLLERFPRRKTLLRAGRAVIMFINIVFIGVIPLFPGADQLKLTIMGASVLLVNLLNAVFSPGVSIWFISFTPERMRSRFFSVISMTNGVIIAFATIGAGMLADFFKTRQMELFGLQAVRGIALLLAVIDFLLVGQMKEYPYENAGAVKFKQLLLDPFRERLYLRTVFIAFLWSLTANIPGPYYTVYLLKDLGVSYSFLMLVGFINVPVLLILAPVWARFVRRFSWFKALCAALSFFLLHYILAAFITGSNIYYLYPLMMLYAYVLLVGINLTFTNIPYINMPKKNQTLFIGFYATVANLGALIGVSIGNAFILATKDIHITLLGVDMGNKQYMMLLVAGMMLVALLLINILRKGTENRETED